LVLLYRTKRYVSATGATHGGARFSRVHLDGAKTIVADGNLPPSDA
jgi:hypothetical protein